MSMERYWINQPSSLQTYHEHHGRYVLADIDSEKGPCCYCYFVYGTVYSQRIHKNALSPGWPVGGKP